MQFERIDSENRWAIVYGNYDGLEAYAINQAQRYMQRALPYVIEMSKKPSDKHLLIIGTPDTNPVIKELISKNIISIETKKESYSIKTLNSIYNPKAKLIIVAASDTKGLLYGIEELNKSVLLRYLRNESHRLIWKDLENIPDISISDFPRISKRGIWTWGYAIYDYKNYFDNMAKCRLNTITIWNDELPINITEVIEYANLRGIDVYLGFAWGWDTFVIDPSDKDKRTKIKEQVIQTYKTDYLSLNIKGIYFQLGFTECSDTKYNNRSIASYCKEWVDDISKELFVINPQLELQFGLHASSIREDYPDLTGLDPRIEIVWEDAGGLPFSYASETGDFQSTLNYCLNIAKTISNKKSFSLVPKGWSHLNWVTEFEHHQKFILGEREKEFIQTRLALRRDFLNSNNNLWLRNYPYAIEFYKTILNLGYDMIVTGLMEDGMLEKEISDGFALFAQMLWNPFADDILSKALTK